MTFDCFSSFSHISRPFWVNKAKATEIMEVIMKNN